MISLKLSQEDRSEMKRFYLEQLEEALRKVKHFKIILKKLEFDDYTHIDTETYGLSLQLHKNDKSQPIPKSISNSTEKSGRGRKSIWGNFILNLLTSENRPLSYTEIIRIAMDKFNLPETKLKNVKQAITNSSFRLRVTNKKIETFGLPGRKERFLCLSAWFNNGVLSVDYQNKLRS
jgi:hypothetical protein